MKKKVVVGLLLALSAMLAITITASAAPGEAKSKKAGPFQGTFNGTVYGDNGTSAPLSLVMTHQGNQVEGTVFLGKGLYVNGGMCGSGYIPAAAQTAAGQTSSNDPGHLAAQSYFKISGIGVKLLLDGDVSADGEQIETKAKIDLPWICGTDPVISGTLYKAQ
jgi:hypothetical protein